jgi:hypothetical protein
MKVSTLFAGETKIDEDATTNEFQSKKKVFSCFGGRETLESLRLSSGVGKVKAS